MMAAPQPDQPTDRVPSLRNEFLRLLVKVSVCVFAVEAFAMWIMPSLHLPEGPAKWFVDAALLAGMLAPCMYWLFAGPRKRAEQRSAGLAKANEELGQEVANRERAQLALGASQAKVALAASEWRDTFGAVDDLVAVIDTNHRVVRANRAMHECFPDRPIIGARCHELFHTACSPVAECPAVKAINGEGPSYLELQEPSLDNHWFSVYAYPIHDKDGAVSRIVHIVRDITESRHVEGALRDFQRAIESASDAIGMASPQGAHYYQNVAFADLFGYTVEELTAAGGPHSVCADSNVADEVFDAIMGGGSWTGEVEMVARGGRRLSVLLRAYALKDAEGGVAALVYSHTDITRRKQMEAALHRAKEQTDAANRSLEDTNRQLEELLARANKMAVGAEAANTAKSEFLANMSHEIRTPLNGVIGMADLLADTELTEEQREFAETIHDCGNALLALVNDILDLSKIEAAELALDSAPFDLLEVIEEAAHALSAKASEKGIELVVTYAPDAPRRVIGDAARLRQVLTNLAGNAIKFTEEGHVLISVGCSGVVDGSGRFRIQVEDTGIGIADGKLGQIFETFTQADASTTRKYGGTGLGLAITRRLVERMGGTVDVHSQLGAGSTFWCDIPLALDPAKEARPADLPDLSGIRVLIAEDNEATRQVLEGILLACNARVTAVATGHDALGELIHARKAGRPYQFAVLDDQMPGMGGEALACAIKLDPEMQDTVLLLLKSARRGPAVPQQIAPEFAGAVSKPIRQREFLAALSDLAPSLPRDTHQEATMPHPTAHSACPDQADAETRALVVEDNYVNQKVAALMLRKLGCSVDVADNGSDALELLEKRPFDIIFMDCQMPQMDGFEATAAIREDEACKHAATPLAIIAMTAHALQGDRERCLDAGMDDYMSKPVAQSHFADMLEKYCGHGPRPSVS